MRREEAGVRQRSRAWSIEARRSWISREEEVSGGWSEGGELEVEGTRGA